MSQATLAQENWTGNQQVSLLDLLDRLLEKGVVVDGEILLTVADIDLVYLGLKCILSSVETLKNSGESPGRLSPGGGTPEGAPGDSGQTLQSQHPSLRGPQGRSNPNTQIASTSSGTLSRNDAQYDASGASQKDFFSEATQASKATPNPEPRSKINVDAEKVEKGLVKLVLTVVELLRKLMERQAIRRMEGGSLRPRKMEELGLAFLRLDEKMKELKKFFGLKDEDLNLNLGPLGNLV